LIAENDSEACEIFTSLVKKLISIAFFYTLLLSAAQIIPDVTNGFQSVATSANGAPVTTVGDIAMTGVRSFVTCVEGGPQAMSHDASSFASKAWNLNLSGAAQSAKKFVEATASTVSGIGIIAGLVTGFILILAFTYLALELVAVQLESMIVLSAGVIMLGFGAARWTTGFVESYLKYALAVGVRLMVLTLWASFIEWQVNPLIHTTLVNGNASPEAYAIVIILALLVAWLTKKLPGFAGSILSGNSTLSGGEMFDAVKKGMIAAGMAATGGAALVAGGAAMGAAGAMGAAEAAGAGAEGAGAMGAAEGAGAGAGAGSGAGGAAGSEGATSVPAPSTPAAQPASEEGVQPPKSVTQDTADKSGKAQAASEIRSSRTSPAESGAFPQAGSQQQPQPQQKTETTGAGTTGSAPADATPGATGNTAAGGGNAASKVGSTTTPDGSADSTATAGSGDVNPTDTAGTNAAPDSGTATSAPDSATPSGSAPSTEKPSDPVDHRPSAPNAPSETPAGSGGSTQPAAPTAPSSSGTSDGGDQQVEATGSDSKQASPWDVLKKGHAELKEVKEMHENLSKPSIGSHQDANVSAPNLGVGHIRD
jgi:type IV secretion system protein TrbL